MQMNNIITELLEIGFAVYEETLENTRLKKGDCDVNHMKWRGDYYHLTYPINNTAFECWQCDERNIIQRVKEYLESV